MKTWKNQRKVLSLCLTERMTPTQYQGIARETSYDHHHNSLHLFTYNLFQVIGQFQTCAVVSQTKDQEGSSSQTLPPVILRCSKVDILISSSGTQGKRGMEGGSNITIYKKYPNFVFLLNQVMCIVQSIKCNTLPMSLRIY